MASRLCRLMGKGNVAVVEPSKVHSYQPMYTLVGAGVTTVDKSEKLMTDVLPQHCVLFESKVAEFDPEAKQVTLSNGEVLSYCYLVIALGMQLNYHKVEGLLEGMKSDPMICSNYSRHTVQKTYPALQAFKGGEAIFTFPNTKVKCAGASHFMYLADDYWRKNGVRDQANITYKTSSDVVFGVERYAETIKQIIDRKDINVDFKRNLTAVDHTKREATFQLLDSDGKQTESCKYDYLHVTPPMSVPDVLKKSKAPLLDDDGFLAVNKYTLQHVTYPEIFGLGDCTNLPTSRTAAAISSQSKVLLQNMADIIEEKEPTAKYDGYTSCPVVTGYNRCILSEFGYDGKHLETLPLDMSKERWLAFQMKEHLMPELYWKGLLKGHWNGPKPFRKIMHLGLCK